MFQFLRWSAAIALIATLGCQQTGTSEQASSSSATTARVVPSGGEGGSASTATEQNAPSDPAAGNAVEAAIGQEVTLPDGLKFQDLQIGTGAIAEKGMTATVHYTGWLTDGTKFDGSLDRGQPFKFQLGAGQVIRGWDEGIKGMRVGGKRKLTIPSALGYGSRGADGVIPPDATLVFEVELLGAQ